MITLLTTPASRHGLGDRFDVLFDQPQIAGLQGADVDDHVDFGRRRRRWRVASRTA